MFPIRVFKNMISLRIWHQRKLLKSLHPLTLTNSITRKSSVAVSISSTSMMIFGCFTLRRMDTSFSIRCSCQRKGLERWVRNHGTLCSIFIFWKMHYCGLDAEGSMSLGAKTKPRTSQCDVSLSLTKRN